MNDTYWNGWSGVNETFDEGVTENELRLLLSRGELTDEPQDHEQARSPKEPAYLPRSKRTRKKRKSLLPFSRK